MYKQKNPAKELAGDRYSKRHRSPSPYRRESSRGIHRGFTHRSSEDDYKSFHPSSHESRESDSYKRYAACGSPDDEQSHFRSFPKEQKEKKYSKPTKSQEPESESGGLYGILPQLEALPPEIFLEIVFRKLERMKLKGLSELSELAKFITKAQEAYSKSLPAELRDVVKQMMFRNVGTHIPKNTSQCENTHVSESRRQDLAQEVNYSHIRDILNQTKESPSSASSNVASHQNVYTYVRGILNQTKESPPSASSNVASHQIVYPYVHRNVASPHANIYTPSSSKTPSIPGLTLTEDQKQSFSLYNAYQSPYS